MSLPALDRGVDRLSIEAFLPWPDLACPLLTQVSYSSLPVLPRSDIEIHQGKIRWHPELISSSTSPQPLFDLLE